MKGIVKIGIKCSYLQQDKQDQPHFTLVQGLLSILDFGSKCYCSSNQPPKNIGPQDFPGSGKNADALGLVAIIPLFLLTHHRLKATIDNCLTTENSADCNFSPEIFLPLVEKNKKELLLQKAMMMMIYLIPISRYESSCKEENDSNG